MLAIVVLALFGGMLAAAARLPEILDKIAGCPPQDPDFRPAAKKDAATPPLTANFPHPLPLSQRERGASRMDSAPEFAERMFTAGLSKDFGVVPFGTQLSHRFKITNIYAAPLEITGLRVGCCCVTAGVPGTPGPGKRVLQPGESTTIDVALDTRQFTGPNTQTVRVAVGPNPSSACVLKVSAVSQTDVVFNPERVAFGTVARGQASSRSIDVQYNGTGDWKIEEAVVAKELPFEAVLSGPVRRAGKVGYRLTVTLKENAGHHVPMVGGRIRDYIYLKTNQADAPPVPLLVTATVQ